MARLGLLVFFIGIISSACVSQQQSIQLALQKRTGEGPFKIGIMPTLVSTADHFILPNIKTSTHLIKHYNFKSLLAQKDTGRMRNLHFFVGRTMDSIVVIPDNNFNNDFTDDSALFYPQTRDLTFALPHIKIGVAGDCRTLMVQPYPYKTGFTYNSNLEQALYLMIRGYEHYELEDSTSNFRLFVANRRPTLGFDQEDLMIAVMDSSGTSIKKIGDFLELNSHAYILASVDKSLKSITLTKVNKGDQPIGINTGFWITPISTTTLAKKKFSIPGNKKYTLLDFWGTWCGPCLELTPKIKMLAERYESQLELLSVAFDSNLHKVNSYIVKNKMHWNHLMESSNDAPNGLIGKFRVSEYPTFVLINRQGKIVHRGATEKALEEIIRILDMELK